MNNFSEINEAWWEWYYKDENGNERNKTSKERKDFFNQINEGKIRFKFKGKVWVRTSSSYSSNSGKTKDQSIIFTSEDGEKISIDSSYKNNRKNTYYDEDR
tara:strand:- start:3407 stop:3709 length:303 start_codon:yes stop_codon:yes gene_type:complete